MPASLILGIETSTPFGGVALADAQGNLLAHRWSHSKTGYSRRLLGTIDSILAEGGWSAGDLAAVAVTRGPGSFTGVRVGLVTAKTLAFSLRLPLYVFSTLECAALRWPVAGVTVCPVFDARRSEIYSGVYRIARAGEAQPLRDPAVEPCDRLLDWLALNLEGGVWFCGDGAALYAPRIDQRLSGRALRIPSPWDRPAADVVAIRAAHALAHGAPPVDPFLAVPDYLRASDAERNLVRAATGAT